MEEPTRSEFLAVMRLAHRALAASQTEVTPVAELFAREGDLYFDRLDEDALCKGIRGRDRHGPVCVLPGATRQARLWQAVGV